jgi:putative N-acetylmannosamine-6-phosphate epimerase
MHDREECNEVIGIRPPTKLREAVEMGAPAITRGSRITKREREREREKFIDNQQVTEGL